MRFYKFQALGNDFLIIRESEVRAVTDDFESFSRSICDRHFGAGADGLELLLDRTGAPNADYEVRLFNSDGGETPISGNGTRCVAAYLYLVEKEERPEVRIATGAGVKTLKPLASSGNELRFEADMGKPRLASNEIPVVLDRHLGQVIGQKLDLAGR